jgi:AMMECR1 domain-containing protein
MKASRELCFYCFDAVVSHLEKQKCAQPEFQDASCPLCISWAKRVKKQGHTQLEARGSLITMTPVRLHSESFLQTIRASAFEDPRRVAITPEDIPYLRCSVSVILPHTYKTLQRLEDWEVGKHGIRLAFNKDGHIHSKVYPPETILARGWNQRTAIEEGVKKAGYMGELTPQFLATVQVIRFETSTCIVSAKDYFRHVEAKEKEARLQAAANPAGAGSAEDEATKKQRMIRRQRQRYVSSLTRRLREDKKRPPAAAATSSSSLRAWILALAVIAVVVGVLILRGLEVVYDKDYDEFQSNYDILGLPRGAPWADVKKAFRRLSLQYHPDKQTNCPDCTIKYTQINAAYKQIGDYEKGALRLVNRPGSSSRSGSAR